MHGLLSKQRATACPGSSPAKRTRVCKRRASQCQALAFFVLLARVLELEMLLQLLPAALGAVRPLQLQLRVRVRVRVRLRV